MSQWGQGQWGFGPWGAGLPAPIINGPNTIDVVIGPTTDVVYLLTNLDPSIVSLILGGSNVGVAIHDFINNGDGTGIFEADFTIGSDPWTIGIIGVTGGADETAEATYSVTAIPIAENYKCCLIKQIMPPIYIMGDSNLAKFLCVIGTSDNDIGGLPNLPFNC